MLKQIRKNNEGFTIIEVLIVLAIAALILLIVFLAVPALQRNSRNTQRNNDVAAVLAAASNASTNNNGAIVTTTCGAANPYSFGTGTTTTCPVTGSVKTEYNLGYYSAKPVIATGAQSALTTDTITLVTGAKCTTPIDGTTAVGSTRQIAVQYMFEPNSTLTATCKDS